MVWELLLEQEKKKLEGARRGYLWARSESELKVSRTSEQWKEGKEGKKKGIEAILSRKEEGKLRRVRRRTDICPRTLYSESEVSMTC